MRQKRFVIGCVLIVLLVTLGLPSFLVSRELQQQHRNKALIAAIYRNDQARNQLAACGDGNIHR